MYLLARHLVLSGLDRAVGPQKPLTASKFPANFQRQKTPIA